MSRRLMSRVRDQRGSALPLGMLALLILSSLIIGFSVLASTEPNIPNHQVRVAQARALAEAGIERAIWALNRGISNPDDTAGIPVSFTTAPAPYDGSQLLMVATGGTTIGGIRVTVANGATPYERNITAVG